MNLDFIIQKLLRRATMVPGAGTKVARSARIRNILGDCEAISAGKNCYLAGELLVFAHGGKIRMGDWCYVGEGSRIWSSSLVELGDRVLVSNDCFIVDSQTHPLNAKQRHDQFVQIMRLGHPTHISLGERPVRIGSDVLLGAKAIVLRGVSIGQGAIVGAGSVLTKDVPEWTIVAGNPARVIRELTVVERDGIPHD